MGVVGFESPSPPAAPAVSLALPCRAVLWFLRGRVSYIAQAASQKKGAVSYCFDPVLHCPPLAALSDDQREEFKPRWQRRTGTKQLETTLFFVCSLGYIGYAAPQEP